MQLRNVQVHNIWAKVSYMRQNDLIKMKLDRGSFTPELFAVTSSMTERDVIGYCLLLFTSSKAKVIVN